MKPCAIFALGMLASALVAAASAQDNEAEKRFRGMEKKIKGAKAFKVVFTYQLEGKTTKGSLLVTNDNKARLQLRGAFHFRVKENARFEYVSDGNQIITKGARLGVATNGQMVVKLGGQTKGETPKTFHAGLATTVSRLGMMNTLWGSGDSDPDNNDSGMKLFDFRSGGKEKVGKREANVVHYKCGRGGMDDPQITVWIDAETGLPLKRDSLIHPESEKIRIHEIYSEFKLNPKIDAKAFELPK